MVQVRRLFGTRVLVLMPLAIALNIILGSIVGQVLRLPIYLDSIGTILVGLLAGPIPGLLTGALTDLLWGYAIPPPVGSPTVGPFSITAGCIGLLAGILGRLGVFRARPGRDGRTIVLTVAAVLLVIAITAYTYSRAYASSHAFNSTTGFDQGAFGASRVAFGIVMLVFAVLAVYGLLIRRDLGAVLALASGLGIGIVAAIVSAPIAAYVFGGVTGSGTDVLVAAFRAGGAGLYAAVLQQGLLSDPLDKMITCFIVYLTVAGLPRRQLLRFPNGERLAPTE
jgi:energy-coupling factor transport system substrate-specific component